MEQKVLPYSLFQMGHVTISYYLTPHVFTYVYYGMSAAPRKLQHAIEAKIDATRRYKQPSVTLY